MYAHFFTNKITYQHLGSFKNYLVNHEKAIHNIKTTSIYSRAINVHILIVVHWVGCTIT